MRIYLESLGCARNLVDSEVMMGRLKGAGWSITEDPAQAEAIVINTCSFIEAAANESIDTILELARYKKEGNCKKLIVAGCLPERYQEDIAVSLPEVDDFLGTGAFDKIVDAVTGELDKASCRFPDPDMIEVTDSPARVTQSQAMAYVKIAEGCSRRCTYCIIPILRGNQKSRPVDQIVSEACELAAAGTRELTLVAQDTTFYGSDLQNPDGLSELLEALSGISPDIWIRFLYGHPESITTSVIETVAAKKNICSYFDIPIQHASSEVLKKMGRHYNRESLVGLFRQIRETVPEAALRTTVIVGFPGETEDDFNTLCDFVKEVEFEHLGVFTYSDAEDLPSHRLKKHVDPETANRRYEELMTIQLSISEKKQKKLIGNTLDVLVEEKREDQLYYGRSMFQAPEVDGIIYIETDKSLEIGSVTHVLITDAMEYDLIGVPA